MAVIIDGSVGSTVPIGNLNAQLIQATYTVPANYNLLTAGPITIDTGYAITVDTGAYWVIT
jgi:hypothetical protein